MPLVENEISQLRTRTVDGDVDDSHRTSVQTNDNCNPILPPELEQQIFTMAFRDDESMDDSWSYLLVAKRTFEWLVPLLYEIVIMHNVMHWPPTHNFPENLPRYGHHVRHLLLEKGKEGNIHYCPNVTNLALVDLEDIGSDLLKTLVSLPLKELSIDISILPESPLLIPFFANITHLDMAYIWSGAALEMFSYFTSLTHLMLLDRDDNQHLVNDIINRVPTLKILVAVYYTTHDILETGGRDLWDPRVVGLSCTFVPHWKAAARGLENPWSFAEGVIARRERIASGN
ncbi:hypothetical protein BDN72DRAFT_881537 [Pluteus cervinus]|uniref:Uncharacterized protein n=1 Tax=Pluteus cervinus TaxID=181527 RepID=A0ACD3AFH3_9AGAR|nr:hypothetical protein BDN72DRAFT_881537 [Pluteus cervinus]